MNEDWKFGRRLFEVQILETGNGHFVEFREGLSLLIPSSETANVLKPPVM